MYFDTRPKWGRVPFDLPAREAWLDVPFELAEYEARWEKTAHKLREQGLDALVVMGRAGDCAGVRWLTNFESYVGTTYVVITAKGECVIATNSLMRAEPMQSGIWMTHVTDIRITSPKRYAPEARTLDALLQDVLGDYGISNGKIGCVGTKPDLATAYLFSDFSDDLADLCAQKSDAEILVLRKANAIASEVFSEIRTAASIGVNETRLAGVAFKTMMDLGAEGSSFSLSLVGGARSGLKHALPSAYALQDGDILFVDFGLIYQGYVTDNARTGIVGKPTAQTRAFVETAAEMTTAAIAAAGPNVAQSAVEQAAFKVASDNGFLNDYYFRAHGVGTGLFGPPRFHPGCSTQLRPNEIFSLEPMLVRHGFGSACVERTLLINDTGVEVLDTDEGIWIDG